MRASPTAFLLPAMLCAALCLPATTQARSDAYATIESPAAGADLLPFETLERRVTDLGLRVSKLEVRDLLLKAEGFDEFGRKVKLTLDRRTGEVLSRELKLPKHMRYGAGGGAHPAARVR